jgi:hypothetical protein
MGANLLREEVVLGYNFNFSIVCRQLFAVVLNNLLSCVRGELVLRMNSLQIAVHVSLASHHKR